MGGGFQINITHSIDEFIARLDETDQHQVPFVTAYALTKTAQDVKAAEVAKMAAVFDRPTRFTLDALFVKPATKQHLVAEVKFKEGFGSIPAWRYLGPEIEGGPRAHKSFELRLIRAAVMRDNEYAVPGQGAKLDGYGNLPGSLLVSILSQLQAAGGTGYLANETARSRKRAPRRSRYFVLRPDQPGPGGRVMSRKIQAGIYEQRGARNLVPIIIFVPAPHYTERLPYFQTAKEIVASRLPIHFHEGWQTFVIAAGASRPQR